jgi:hypothetical protein
MKLNIVYTAAAGLLCVVFFRSAEVEDMPLRLEKRVNRREGFC